MINSTLDTVSKLQTALIVAEVFVGRLPKNTPFQKFEQRSLCYFYPGEGLEGGEGRLEFALS